MSPQEKWIVLLPPGSGGTTATPVGPFDSKADALAWLDDQNAEASTRAYVLPVQPPASRP
jgi:hypothetical protein